MEKPLYKTPSPIFFFAIGIFFLCMSVPEMLLGMATTHWPVTEGRVLRSSMTPVDDDGSTYYEPHMTYEFWVNTRRFESDHITYNARSLRFPSENEAHQFLADYQESESFHVYYQEKKPEIAVLIPGYDINRVFVFFIGIGMIIGGGAVFFKTRHVLKGIYI